MGLKNMMWSEKTWTETNNHSKIPLREVREQVKTNFMVCDIYTTETPIRKPKE